MLQKAVATAAIEPYVYFKHLVPHVVCHEDDWIIPRKRVFDPPGGLWHVCLLRDALCTEHPANMPLIPVQCCL